MENIFSPDHFFTKLNAHLILHYKINLPKSLNQRRKRDVLILPDNVSCLCAVKVHCFYCVGNTDYTMFTMRWKKSVFLLHIAYLKSLRYKKQRRKPQLRTFLRNKDYDIL